EGQGGQEGEGPQGRGRGRGAEGAQEEAGGRRGVALPAAGGRSAAAPAGRPPGRARSFQVLPEEGQRAPPGVVGRRSVVDVGPLFVEERVVDAGIDVDRRGLPGTLDGLVDL